MKQSHGLPELPKRRFTLCDASHLSGVESWADSPRKSHKKPLDHHPERLKAGHGNTKPAHLVIEMSNLPLAVFLCFGLRRVCSPRICRNPILASKRLDGAA